MKQRYLNVAHRGASAYEPENTLRSIRRAIEMGADMSEIDLHLSKDGVLIVMHDYTVDHTTNGQGAIKELTLAEIKTLDAGQGEPVPTLQEVIDLVRESQCTIGGKGSCPQPLGKRAQCAWEKVLGGLGGLHEAVEGTLVVQTGNDGKDLGMDTGHGVTEAMGENAETFEGGKDIFDLDA